MQNDLVMAGSGETREDIGKTAVMNKEIRAYAGGDVIVFRPSKMKGTFLSYVMNSTLGKQQLGQRGTGATIFHIYPDELKKIFVPVPSIEAQNKKVEKLESFYKNISFAEEELIKSKKLQQAMLNQIF